MATCLLVPSQVHAFEMQWTPGQLWLLGLITSAPGLLLSALPLRRVTSYRATFLLVFTRWVLLTPAAALLLINLISPGILGQTHAHPGWELFLRIWLIGSLAPLAPAWLWRWVASARLRASRPPGGK